MSDVLYTPYNFNIVSEMQDSYKQAGIISDQFTNFKNKANNAIGRLQNKSLTWMDNAGQAVSKSSWLDNEHKRNAARLFLKAVIGGAGIGGGTALLFSLRRGNVKKLLDKEKAKATLPMPVLPSKYGSAKDASALGKILAGATVAGGAGLGIAANLTRPAHNERALESKPLSDPNDTRPYSKKFKDFMGRIFNYEKPPVPEGSRLGNTITKPIEAISSWVTGEPTPDKKPAEGNFYDPLLKVWWGLPAVAAGVGGGSYLAYRGINSMIANRRRKKLEQERDAVRKRFEEALLAEQGSKLGSALNEYVDEFEKNATLSEHIPPWYLGILATLALYSGVSSFNKGRDSVDQQHRLSALNKVRDYQLAERRESDLSVLPQPVTSMPKQLGYEKPKDDDEEEKLGEFIKRAAVNPAFLESLALRGIQAFKSSRGLSKAVEHSLSSGRQFGRVGRPVAGQMAASGNPASQVISGVQPTPNAPIHFDVATQSVPVPIGMSSNLAAPVNGVSSALTSHVPAEVFAATRGLADQPKQVLSTFFDPKGGWFDRNMFRATDATGKFLYKPVGGYRNWADKNPGGHKIVKGLGNVGLKGSALTGIGGAGIAGFNETYNQLYAPNTWAPSSWFRNHILDQEYDVDEHNNIVPKSWKKRYRPPVS